MIGISMTELWLEPLIVIVSITATISLASGRCFSLLSANAWSIIFLLFFLFNISVPGSTAGTLHSVTVHDLSLTHPG